MYDVGELDGRAYLSPNSSMTVRSRIEPPPKGGHRNIVLADPMGAMAHLQLGRALAQSGDMVKAKTVYKDLLNLWRDADPDLPILNQVQAEHAKLR